MNSFSRYDVQTLRRDIDAALVAVAAKHGVNISLGNCRFTLTEARFAKLIVHPKSIATIVTAGSSSVVDSPEAREYQSLAYMFNLPKDGLGKTFMSLGKMFTIAGLKSSRRKYPVSAVSSTGRRFKFTAEQVRNGLVK